MKKSIYFLLLLTVMFANACLCGCTHNNGDIGPWFGTWKLEKITIDGEPDSQYGANIFWKFQTGVFSMVEVTSDTPAKGYNEIFGTWNEDNGYLFLDFNHHDDTTPTESSANSEGRYAPFEETHLPGGVESMLKIESLIGKKAFLTFDSPNDGKIYGYYLEKYG